MFETRLRRSCSQLPVVGNLHGTDTNHLKTSTERQFYDEGKPFTCLDGSRTIPFDRVNDDYCDCRDGSDEPGVYVLESGDSSMTIQLFFHT